MIIKDIKSVTSDYKKKIKCYQQKNIDFMATDIFDINNLEEIEKYFEKDK